MTESGKDQSYYGLDPGIAESVKEIATIQARLAALELVNSEIKPEIKELTKTKWGIIGTVATVFFIFMGLLIGLQHQAQVSDYDSNQALIHHAEDHLMALEKKISELRAYVDNRNENTRSVMFTVHEHEIFDKERYTELQNIERRLDYLEHKTCK